MESGNPKLQPMAGTDSGEGAHLPILKDEPDFLVKSPDFQMLASISIM